MVHLLASTDHGCAGDAERPPKYVDTSKSIRRAARYALTGRVSWSEVSERVRARGAVAHVRWARSAVIATEEQKLATAVAVVHRCAHGLFGFRARKSLCVL